MPHFFCLRYSVVNLFPFCDKSRRTFHGFSFEQRSAKRENSWRVAMASTIIAGRMREIAIGVIDIPLRCNRAYRRFFVPVALARQKFDSRHGVRCMPILCQGTEHERNRPQAQQRHRSEGLRERLEGRKGHFGETADLSGGDQPFGEQSESPFCITASPGFRENSFHR